MAFTRVLGPGIHTQANIDSHNINSTGIITAVSFVGDGSGLTGVASTDNIITGTAATFTGGVDINSDIDVDGHTNLDNVSIAGVTTFSGGLTGTTANFSGNVTVGGVLTYEDVKNVDSVGIITARSGVDVDDFLDVGSNIQLGNAGIITASSYRGDGSQLTGLNADSISEGNTKAEVSDTGSNGRFFVNTEGSERFSIDSSGDFTFNNCNDSVFNAGGNLTIDYKMSNSTKLRWMLQANDLKLYPMADDYPINIWNSDATKQIKVFRTGEVNVGYGISLSGTTGNINATGIVTATAFKLADGSAVGAGAGGTWSTYTAGIATSKSVGINTSNLDDNDLVGVGNSFQGLYISNGMIIHDNTLNGNHYIGTTMNGLMAGPVNIEGTLTVDGNYVVV